MAYKIVLNTTVVDAQSTLNYVYWQVKNHLLLVGRSDFANGIVSSDGSTVCHLDAHPHPPDTTPDTLPRPHTPPTTDKKKRQRHQTRPNRWKK